MYVSIADNESREPVTLSKLFRNGSVLMSIEQGLSAAAAVQLKFTEPRLALVIS